MDCIQTRTKFKSGTRKTTGLILITLTLFFKVTIVQRILINALSALYVLKKLMDSNQTCTDISLGDTKVLIKLW